MTSSTNPTEPEIRTVSLVSLGCPKNLVDSEKMLGLLAEDGFIPISFDPGGNEPPADAVIINTCGFLEASKEESLGVIQEALEAKRAGRVRRVVVAGCLVQRHRARLLDWAPGIDALIGVFDRDRITSAVRGSSTARDSINSPEAPPYWIAANALHAARERGMSTANLTVNGKDGKGIGYFEDDSARLRLTPRHYAYLRISEGCNQNCAFCTIPSIRGKMRSKPLDAIAREARELIEDGAVELNLIGQDTTSYGDDLGQGFDFDDSGGGGLPALLETVNHAIEQHAGGQGWARLMYAYPSTFNDAMIDALADLPHVAKYVDMPLQHASDRILQLMRRNVSASEQENLIRRLRERCPSLALRTTLITGFPGETEADHEQLLEFVERTRFEALGVFEFSAEDGTRAGTMDHDPELHVPAEIKARRYDEIMSLQQGLAFDRAAQRAALFDPARPGSSGERIDVLIDRVREAPNQDGCYLADGRTESHAPDIDAIVRVEMNMRTSPGELVRSVIVDSDGYDLVARPAHEITRDVRLPVV